jgi:integrase
MKLKEALHYFLLVDRAGQTQTTYSRVLTRFAEQIGPGRPLDLIRPEDLDAYVHELRSRTHRYEDHPTRPTEEGPLALATVHKHTKTIRVFFNWCVDRGYIRESPARFLVNRRPVRPLGQGKAATDAEVTEILAAARYKPRDWAVVLLLAQSGCRAGDIAGLTMNGLDLDDCKAVVDGKGDKRRTIYFGSETADAIRAWLTKRPQVDHDYVFTSARGHGALKVASVSQIVRRLSLVAGLERSLGAHSIRHFVGMKMARMHVAPTIIQHYLGHSDVTITMGYIASVDEGDLRAAGQLLSLSRADAPGRNNLKEIPPTE